MANAILTLSNWGGIEIRIEGDGDSLEYRFHNGDTWTEWVETAIEYVERRDEEGDEEMVAAFFVDDETTDEETRCAYYLSEFMRID